MRGTTDREEKLKAKKCHGGVLLTHQRRLRTARAQGMKKRKEGFAGKKEVRGSAGASE